MVLAWRGRTSPLGVDHGRYHRSVKAGVLALQGDFREHARVLRELGAAPVEVRLPRDLDEVECLAIPGGESTTISKLARSRLLVDPIRERAAAGMPILGTCAGMIVMASEVRGGDPLLRLIDLAVSRNAYGRQIDSFETDVEVEGQGPVRGVFIRAPVVERVGDDVQVLARQGGTPVVCEQGSLIAATFHPELVGDGGLHRRMLERVG